MAFKFNPFTANFDIVDANTNEDSTVIDISQAGHGFAIGSAIYYDASTWGKAQSNNIETLGIGIVSSVTDDDNFTVTIAGKVTGLTGCAAGSYYYVSETTAGSLSLSAGSTYVNPLFQALTDSTGIVLPLRAEESTGLFDVVTRSDWDYTNIQHLYTGKAVPGSNTGSPVWRISRFDTSSGSLTYADGDQLYNNIYDNRESLTYEDL